MFIYGSNAYIIFLTRYSNFQVRRELSTFWPVLAAHLPEKLFVGKGKPHIPEVIVTFYFGIASMIKLLMSSKTTLQD